jgi:hypothetical protein
LDFAAERAELLKLREAIDAVNTIPSASRPG